jgi:Tol biopolymer transport system component
MILVACVSMGLTIATLLVHRFEASPSSHNPAPPMPFTSFLGQETNPTWSPDGKKLAYTWDEDRPGHFHNFLQQMGEAMPIRLTKSSTQEFRPVWSPDGHEIAFLRSVGTDRFQVIRHRVDNGAESPVITVSYSWPLSDDPPALDWSPDGSTLLVSEQPSPAAPVRLVLVNIATGRSRIFTQPKYGTSGDIEAKFSPDGSRIAFRRGGLGDLYVAAIEGEAGTTAQQLTNESMGVRGIAWSADGRFIFFGHYRDNGYAIWKISAEGGDPTPVTSSEQDIEPTVSHDGHYLAFEHHDLATNLIEIPLGTSEAPKPLSPSDKLDGGAAYSPDGKRLAFVSNRSGSEELWMQSSEGSDLHQITHLQGIGVPIGMDWSPDNRSLVLSIRSAGSTNLFVYRQDNSNLEKISSSKDRFMSPLYSKDGRYIYFSSNSEGDSRIWRLPLDGARSPEQMYGDNAIYFQQSDDGRYLYFTTPGGSTLQIMRRNLKTGGLDSIFRSDRKLYGVTSYVVHHNVLYMLVSTQLQNTAELLALDLNHGTIRSLRQIDNVEHDLAAGSAVFSNLTVSPDGRAIVLAEIQRSNADVYFMPL